MRRQCPCSASASLSEEYAVLIACHSSTFGNKGTSLISEIVNDVIFFGSIKNYGRDLGNPELDQLSGRFSPSRGQVGLLACRDFVDKKLFIQRCRDTAVDQRGYVIALDDGDLSALVDARRADDYATQFQLLQDRFQRLVM